MEFFWEAFALVMLTRVLSSYNYTQSLSAAVIAGNAKLQELELSWPNILMQIAINTGLVLILNEILKGVY